MAVETPRDLLLQISESVRYYVETLRDGGMLGLPRLIVDAAKEPKRWEMAEKEEGLP